VNTAREAVQFVHEAGRPNLGVLLDAYHMNIEEPDPCAAVCAGARLFLFHAADSNRQAWAGDTRILPDLCGLCSWFLMVER